MFRSFIFQNGWRFNLTELDFFSLNFRRILWFLRWLSFSPVIRLGPFSSAIQSSWSWALLLGHWWSRTRFLLIIKHKSGVSNRFNSSFIVYLVVHHHSGNIGSYVFHKSKSLEDRNVLDQFLILFVIVPIHNRHATLRLEQIADGRVVK